MTTESTIKVELKEFNIHVSEQDILTKVSEFNPYPEQATQGILIWSIYHPTTNPLVKIKYPATGNVYATSIPLSYPSEDEICPPTLLEQEPQPMKSREGGESYGHWMTLTEYVSSLAYNFVDDYLYEGANLERIAEAVVNHYDDGTPVFEEVNWGFIKLVRLAFKLLQEGDYHTAAIIIGVATRTGAYEIGGEIYPDEASAMFEYCTWNIAIDVCPILRVDEPESCEKRGLWTTVNDLAGEIVALANTTVRLQALRQIMLVEKDEMVRTYLQIEVERAEHHLDRVQNSMENRKMQRVDLPGKYLSLARRYFRHRDIVL